VNKRFIEYNLPLADISEASAREKNIRHGHPSTLHIWWARRPLASSRATAFAALIDDPGEDHPQGWEKLLELIECLLNGSKEKQLLEGLLIGKDAYIRGSAEVIEQARPKPIQWRMFE